MHLDITIAKPKSRINIDNSHCLNKNQALS